MIQFEKVRLSYGEKIILQEINLSIQQGSTHILLGLSGSGKSTLLKVLLGLLPIDRGQVQVNENIQKFPVDFFWRQQFGYVPQDGGLFPHMTGEENVTLLARTLGWEKKKIQKRVDEVCPLVSLPKHLLKRYPKELSGGQKQRVAVMRALFLNPDILLFDEPLGALDPLIRNDLQSELKRLFSELKKTVIFVTHDVAEASFLGDEITLLRNGKVLQTGSLEQINKSPVDEFVVRFFNSQRTMDAD